MPIENAPTKINVIVGQSSTSIMCWKRGRPIGSKDTNPRKKLELYKQVGITEVIRTLEQTMT